MKTVIEHIRSTLSRKTAALKIAEEEHRSLIEESPHECCVTDARLGWERRYPSGSSTMMSPKSCCRRLVDLRREVANITAALKKVRDEEEQKRQTRVSAKVLAFDPGTDRS